MKKVWLFTTLMVLGFSCVAFAADGEGNPRRFSFSSIPPCSRLGDCYCGHGCGIGQGMAVKGAVEGIARNPESSGKVTVTMLIGLAMIESLSIYALVVALILIYANPISSTIAAFVGLSK